MLDIDGTPYDIFTGENVIGRDALSDIVIDKGVSHLQFVPYNYLTIPYSCGKFTKRFKFVVSSYVLA